MALGRIITQSEWLGVMAETLQLPPAELLARTDLLTLDAALEAPAAHYRGVGIHPSLADQAAALTEAMLRRPPFPAGRRALAYLTLELFVGHSGARLRVTPAQRDALLREAEGSQPTRQRLAAWIGERLEPRAGPVTSPTGTHSAPAPRIYVALPVAAICDDADACRHVRALAAAAEAEIRDFAAAARWPAVRVEVEAIPYVGGDAPPAGDLSLDDFQTEVQRFTEVSPDNALRRKMLAGLRASDAIVILGTGHPSFGSGNESGRASSAAAQLFLYQRGNPLSRWIADEPGFAFLRLRPHDQHPEDVARAVREWLQERSGVIERHWRRRQARLLVFGETAATFARTWSELESGRARLEAYAATGLPVDRFCELLSPDGVATASQEEIRAMYAALSLPAGVTSAAPQRVFVLSAAQRDWLVRFADTIGLTRVMERSLEVEAERQMALGVLRYALTSIDDWYAFAREIAHRQLG